MDRDGYTVDFLLTVKRDRAAARRFLEQAIDLHDLPQKITIDKSGANAVAIAGVIVDTGVPIQLRQSKYLNNIIEQDHRFIKRVIDRCWSSNRFAVRALCWRASRRSI